MYFFLWRKYFSSDQNQWIFIYLFCFCFSVYLWVQFLVFFEIFFLYISRTHGYFCLKDLLQDSPTIFARNSYIDCEQCYVMNEQRTQYQYERLIRSQTFMGKERCKKKGGREETKTNKFWPFVSLSVFVRLTRPRPREPCHALFQSEVCSSAIFTFRCRPVIVCQCRKLKKLFF